MMRRLLIGVVLVACALPVLLIGALWSGQEKMIFPGPPVSEDEVRQRAARAGASLLHISTPDGERLLAWHEDRGTDAAILYFHGNGSICDRPTKHRRILEARDISVVCIAYRGYPGSTGEPSEEGLHVDALAAYNWVTHELGIDPSRVLVHGRSLGGGVAARLASRVSVAGVVLESTFRSVRRVAEGAYPGLPVQPLLRHPFDTESIADDLSMPTLVLHGDLDRVIDVSHGRWLGAHIPSAQYVEAPGHDHNSGLLTEHPASREAYERFLDEHIGPR